MVFKFVYKRSRGQTRVRPFVGNTLKTLVKTGELVYTNEAWDATKEVLIRGRGNHDLYFEEQAVSGVV